MSRRECFLPASLAEWLAYLEGLHPAAIELGLERVEAVRARLKLVPRFPIFTVGGTNGKGSTCAFLEAMLRAAGLRVGCYTSPHLLAYNERVRIGGVPVRDDDLCRAFAAVEAARGAISLTYFEFGTLAAMWLFIEAGVEVAVLEVGMGGRLDAVNVFDPDIAVVTTVDLDHMAYLGPDREAIGREKAGIYRAGRFALCADHAPPESLLRHALAIGARLRRIDHEFGWEEKGGGLTFWHQGEAGRLVLDDLPPPALAGMHQRDNAAAAIEALILASPRLWVPPQAIREGLRGVQLAGRFQVLPGRPRRILDVAHNPHGARALAASLAADAGSTRTLAVCAMLADKDMAGVVQALADSVDAWYVASLPPPRGASGAELAEVVREVVPGVPCLAFGHVAEAYEAACVAAGQDDRILIFGSFYTVAALLAHLRG